MWRSKDHQESFVYFSFKILYLGWRPFTLTSLGHIFQNIFPPLLWLWCSSLVERWVRAVFFQFTFMLRIDFHNLPLLTCPSPSLDELSQSLVLFSGRCSEHTAFWSCCWIPLTTCQCADDAGDSSTICQSKENRDLWRFQLIVVVFPFNRHLFQIQFKINSWIFSRQKCFNFISPHYRVQTSNSQCE